MTDEQRKDFWINYAIPAFNNANLFLPLTDNDFNGYDAHYLELKFNDSFYRDLHVANVKYKLGLNIEHDNTHVDIIFDNENLDNFKLRERFLTLGRRYIQMNSLPGDLKKEERKGKNTACRLKYDVEVRIHPNREAYDEVCNSLIDCAFDVLLMCKAINYQLEEN